MTSPFFLLFCILGILILSCVIFLVVRALWEPHQLEKTSVAAVPDNALTNVVLRVAFFSDLHADMCFISPHRLAEALLSCACDVVLFGGDVCRKNKDTRIGLSYLKIIADKARVAGLPCFAVRGNHDAALSKKAYADAGFTLLENESVIVPNAYGRSFVIIGVDDAAKHHCPFGEQPVSIYRGCPEENRLVLVHNPQYLLTPKKLRFAWQLSGHFHGRQIYMPFRLEFYLFRREAIARQGIFKGYFKKDGVQGYISRGCGCTLLPFRLFSKPEITHVYIRGA